MKTFAIRPVETADQERWLELLRAYAAFYETRMDAAAEAQVWHWIFDTEEDFWCDFATDQTGAVVGFLQYQLMHRSLSGAKVCYLSDVFVEPEVRGSGAGRALFDHAFAFARGRGIQNVRWLTQEFNYAGRKLYDRYARKSDFILYSVPVEE